MFHLHLHHPGDDLPDDHVEVADCCRALPDDDQMATITADEREANMRPMFDRTKFVGWDDTDRRKQSLRLLRQLVDEANAADKLRGEVAYLRGLVLRMAGEDMIRKLQSDKVIDGLAKDIAGLTILNPTNGDAP